jgi:hypothetical protein
VHHRFHFKDFWLRLDGFQEVVAEAWSSVGNVRHKLAICRELIFRFDKARELRTLTLYEVWLHKTLKLSHLGYASLERTIDSCSPES